MTKFSSNKDGRVRMSTLVSLSAIIEDQLWYFNPSVASTYFVWLSKKIHFHKGKNLALKNSNNVVFLKNQVFSAVLYQVLTFDKLSKRKEGFFGE